MKTFLIILIFTSLYFAQQKQEKEKFINKRFEIGIFLATTTSGPSQDIEDQMSLEGFNVTSYGWWFKTGPITHPFSKIGFGEIGFPWMINLKYFYKSSLGFGLIYSNNPIGETLGYNGVDYLFIQYYVKSFAPLVWYKIESLSFGIGPVLHYVKNFESSNYDSPKNYENYKLGILAELSLVFPIGHTFFYSGFVQYRFVGNSKVGPYTVGYGERLSTFREVNANFNHFLIGLGVGFRIN